MSLTGLMEAYAQSLKQAAVPTEPFADPSKEELKAAPIADVVLNYRPKSKQPKPRKRKKAKRVRMRAV